MALIEKSVRRLENIQQARIPKMIPSNISATREKSIQQARIAKRALIDSDARERPSQQARIPRRTLIDKN